MREQSLYAADQSHPPGPEDPIVHQRNLAVDDRPERHPGQNVALQVDAGRDLDQLQAGGRQPEDAALGDVQDGLAGLDGGRAAERDVVDLFDELGRPGIPFDHQLAIRNPDLRVAGHERPHEHHLFGVLADVDEAARTGQPRPELAHVQVAVPVGLGQAQHGQVQPAAVVEVELGRLVDQRVHVGGRAEVQPAGRDAADRARLGRERHGVQDALFVGDAGYQLRHADAQVDHHARPQRQRRAAGDDRPRYPTAAAQNWPPAP